MTWRIATPLIALLLCCPSADSGSAQAARVVFKGRVKAVDGGSLGSMVTKTITVSIESLDGSGRSVSLFLKNEIEARLFGYGDEVMVEIAPTGRKAE